MGQRTKQDILVFLYGSMTEGLYNSVARVLTLSWLTGPVFDKELRVHSRQRRSYVIRFAYLMFLTALITLAWIAGVSRGSGGSAVYKVSRMGEVGKTVVLTITWFQFVAAQVIAVALLSNSISEEIRRGTLEVLMATPINSFQLVTGKMLSKLLQLILLLALSLPLLAVVRVFGAVQWSYVVASVCITFTAVLFAGSLSMLLSIRIHRPYMVILVVLIFLVVVYSASQFALFGTPNSMLTTIVNLVVPAAAMMQVTWSAFPGPAVAKTFSLPAHCLVMTLVSLVFVAASVLLLRRSAFAAGLRPRKKAILGALQKMFIGRTLRRRDGAAAGGIRPIAGSPVLWKELGKPLSRSVTRNVVLFILLASGLIFTYYISFRRGGIGPFYAFYIMGLWLIASIRTGVMAATTITREKEARTWSILLATPLEDWHIIRGKIIAVLWRNAPAWLVLAFNSVVFYFFIRLFGPGLGFPQASQFIFLILVGLFSIIAIIALLAGSGIYFSVRLKSSTAAVMATIGATLGLFILQRFAVPILMSIAGGALFTTTHVVRMIGYCVPLVLYVAAGLFLIWRAKCLLRQNIF